MEGHRDEADDRPAKARSQLGMWGDGAQETVIGALEEGESSWKVFAIVEQVSEELARGWLSFRTGEERHETAPILLEETAARVVQRAADLPESTLRQLLGAARR